MIGRLLHFRGGYCFARPVGATTRDQNIFVAGSALTYAAPATGDRVEFDVVEVEGRGPRAENVRLLERACGATPALDRVRESQRHLRITERRAAPADDATAEAVEALRAKWGAR
jgi:cold shock CspA family protein